MPRITTDTIKEIESLLSPLLNTRDERRALVDRAIGFDQRGEQLRNRINFDGSTSEFVVALVRELYLFGEITPGKQAIWIVMEVASEMVGADKQARFIALREMLNTPGEQLVSTEPLPDDTYAPPSNDYIFVSYARSNKDRVLQFIADLERLGVRVWVDQSGLVPGTLDWEQALRDAIRGSLGVILAASPDARRSAYVKDEVRIAQMYGRAIYPTWVDGEQWMDSIPMGMGGIQAVDLRGRAYAENIQRLAQTLLALKGGPGDEDPRERDLVIRNPYMGLQAFTADDSRYYFGRDDLVDDLLGALTENARFLAVVGASGSGKSSVVMAGLLPRLQDAHPDWTFLRRVVPGSQPLEELAKSIAAAIPGSLVPTIQREFEYDSALLSLDQLSKQINTTRTVLFVDQFEELFTQSENEGERARFIGLLTNAITNPNGTLLVILTMRADFMDRPLAYEELATLFEDFTVFVKPMTVSNLRLVITEPAGLQGLTFDDNLVGDLLFEVRGESGALPLLEFTLEQLYETRQGSHLTRAAYDAIGGVRGALAGQAQKAYDALQSDRHRSIARALFLRLVEPGTSEQETTRRRIDRSELILLTEVDNAIMREVVQHFIQARLIVADENNIEIAHEALIREWELLNSWVLETRDNLRVQRQLLNEARIWEEQQRDPNFLALGGRLAQYEALQEFVLLSQTEQIYLERSLEYRTEQQESALRQAQERARIAEENERQKEQLLEQERAAGERQRTNTRRTALLALVAVALFIVAAILGLFANYQLAISNTRATEVIKNQETLIGVEAQATNAQTVAAALAISDTLRLELATEAENASNSEGTAIAALATSNVLSTEAIQNEQELSQGTVAAEQATNAVTVAAALATSDTLSVALATEAENAFNNEATAIVALATSDTLSVALATEAENAFNNEATAIVALAISNALGTQAVDSRQAELEQAATAAVAATVAINNEQIAIANADAAATAEMIAITERNLSLSRNLAAQSELLLQAGEYPLAISLALESNEIPGAPVAVQRVLSLAAYTGPRDIKTNAPYGGATVVVYCPRVTERSTISRWLVGYSNGKLTYWGVNANKLTSIKEFEWHNTSVTALACNADGSRAASGDLAGNIVIWEVDRANPLTVLTDTETVTDADVELNVTPTAIPPNIPGIGDVLSLAFSPDGASLIAGYDSTDDTYSGRLLLWNLATDAIEITFAGHTDAVKSVAFSPDSDEPRIISGALNGEIILWDVTERDILKRIQYPARINSVAYSEEGARIATAAEDGIITLWDAATLQVVSTFNGHGAGVNQVVFGNDDTQLASASTDRQVILWDIEKNEIVRRYQAHEQRVNGVAFSGTSNYLLSASSDGAVILWDQRNGAERYSLADSDIPEHRSFDFVGNYAITAYERTLYLWQIAQTSGAFRREYVDTSGEGHDAAIQVVAFSPDGSKALSGDINGYVVLWDTGHNSSGQAVRRWAAHADPVIEIAFSRDGRTAVTTSAEREVRIWDVDRMMQINTLETATPSPTPAADAENAAEADFVALEGNVGTVRAAAYDSSNPPRIATGSDSGDLILWDALTGEQLLRLVGGHNAAITAVAFSPDNKTLISASVDRTLIAWNVDNSATEATADDSAPSYGDLITILRQHTAPVLSVAFNNKGDQIVSTSEDQTVIVWAWDNIGESPTISATTVLVGHSAAVIGARFNSGGSSIVSADREGHIITWRVDSRPRLVRWTRDERFFLRLDEHDTINGQNGCKIREQFSFHQQCTADNHFQTPLPTPYLTPTATATATATPAPDTYTATPEPTQVLQFATEQWLQDSAPIIAKLRDGDQPFVHSRIGYEAERIDWHAIDVSFQRNIIRSRTLNGQYTNFVMHALIEWGPGALQDRCGVAFGRRDAQNYYIFQVDQLGNWIYSELADGVWQTDEADVAERIEPLRSNTDPNDYINTRENARIVLIVEGGEVTVFVNNNWVADFSINPLELPTVDNRIGYASLVATVLQSSRESGCLFKDVWVYDLDHDSQPPPTPMPEPLPALQYDSNRIPQPDELVNHLRPVLNESGPRVTDGFLAERASRLSINLGNLPANSLTRAAIESLATYTDFVMSAVVEWNGDAQADECGYIFRYRDGDNYFRLSINRSGQVIFGEQEDSQAIPKRYLDGSAIQTGIDARNYVVVIGQQLPETDEQLPSSRFIVYINGHYAGIVEDNSHQEGLVWLFGLRQDADDSSSDCTFNNVSVWSLSEEVIIEPIPTSTPVRQSDPIAIDTPITHELAWGGRDIWTLEVAEGAIVNIYAEAERPANDADMRSRIDRRLLDIEVRILRDNEVKSFASDIILGRETNATINQFELSPGTYEIEVYSFDNLTGGWYTLTVSSTGLTPATEAGD